MKCYICDAHVEQELMVTVHDNMILGFHAVVIRNTQIVICGHCSTLWSKVLELLLMRFKEQKNIDEDICKKIVEHKEQDN